MSYKKTVNSDHVQDIARTPLDVEVIKLRASCLGSRLACVEIVKIVGT